jgi:class 3 adenylate cyclase
LGLLARAHKDLGAAATSAFQERQHLQLAAGFYRDAFRLSGGIWTGINAATLALLLDQPEESARLARLVREQCARERSDPSRASDYWLQATLGEAALILGDWHEAQRAYAAASALGRSRAADVASTRRNARLIIQHLGIDGAPIERCFRVPRVAAFVGHMIDRPERESPRFPPGLEAAALEAIREKLAALDVGFGYSSAACGADILFAESLLERDGSLHIVLPYNSTQFVADSVDLIPGANWVERYAKILDLAEEVTIGSEQRMAGGALSHQYAARLLEGMADLRAEELDGNAIGFALWDGRSAGGPGGTGETVERWRSAGRRVEVIDLRGLAPDREPVTVTSAAGATPWATGSPAPSRQDARSQFEPQIVAMLFADARGFSALTEEQIPSFVEKFLGVVSDLLARMPRQPILRNTWGDGLYLVFDAIGIAGEFALELAEAVGRTDWTTYGLPRELSFRIALHAGPAYACIDPVTARPNYLGSHVSRAARLEPITPPGQVYASRAFAAMARAEGTAELRCDYVGRTPLAKQYGTLPMYLVRRRHAHLPG